MIEYQATFNSFGGMPVTETKLTSDGAYKVLREMDAKRPMYGAHSVHLKQRSFDFQTPWRTLVTSRINELPQ